MDNVKKFEDFLDRMQGLLDNAKKQGHIIVRIEDLENAFPELKDSEDGKIRKIITLCLEECVHKDIIRDYEKDKALAWLEKQGEQLTLEKATKTFLEALSETPYNNTPIVQAQASAKQLLVFLTDPKSYNPDSEVEPKFHEGDWVVYECGDETATLQITRIVGETYVFSDNSTLGVVDEDTLRLWDIAKDAKDGDVLCYEDEISIYKHDIKNCTKQETTFGGFVYHCCYDGKRFIMDSLYSLTEQDKIDIHPATKEQRDLLSQKIKEAGCEWNAEKKELKHIEQWKPSGEQMKYLHKYAEQNNYDGVILTSLYNNLKELKQL